jgi:hypothetical protein
VDSKPWYSCCYRGPLGFARGRLFDSDAFAMANASSLRMTVNIEGAGRGAQPPQQAQLRRSLGTPDAPLYPNEPLIPVTGGRAK